MAESARLQKQIGEFAAAIFDGSIEEAQFDRFKALLEENPEARKLYAEIVGLHVGLQDVCGAQPLSDGLALGHHVGNSTQVNSASPGISPDLTPPKEHPFGSTGGSGAAPNSDGFLSFPRSLYAVGLPGVVMALFLVLAVSFGWLGDWPWSKRSIARVVRQSVDTQWQQSQASEEIVPDVASLEWCHLTKGMVQLEFRQGASVLLEGPSQFRVLNDNAFEMQSGKISASVPKSAHGFAVLAPNVKVIDLGTEFGVDVSRSDATSVQVTSGRVAIKTYDSDNLEIEEQELIENQCITVSRNGDSRAVRFGSVNFPKRLFDASIDLVDVVCGGSGNDLKRGYAIDCLDGKWEKLTESFTGKLPDKIPVASNAYHAVSEVPFVDGVFVPSNRKGPMPIDSAGHKFFGFGTKNSGQSYDKLMAGAELKYFKPPRYPVRLMVDGVDFTKPPHGLLVMRGNKGITFDLNKIRAANPGMKITHFRSLAANTESTGELKLLNGPFRGDLWVIIDGKAAYVRTGLTSADGTLDLDIPIPDGASFLTLATTEGRRFSTHDWIVFANPTLEMVRDSEK